METGNRRLAALMFTDMVGFTSMGQRSEPLALALVEEQRRLIRPILERHNGREIKTMGDAFLVEFPSAVDAVTCAYDIQRAAREYGFALPADRRIHLRIGLHLGEVTDSEGDIFGDAVNIASRIEPLAEDGGVCLTRQVRDQVQNKIDLALESIGDKQLKGVVSPVEIYRIHMPWESNIGRLSTSGKKRVAVLPFTNMSPDPNDEYFADGMTEEVILALSGIDGMEVISRTSVMQYKKTSKHVRDVARELEVESVLEGSVRKSGSKLRVVVQMIDAQRDKHVWAERYDADLEDVFEIQSQIADKVSSALQSRAKSPAPTAPPEDLDAYTKYLRAVQLYNEGTESSLNSSALLLDEVLSKHPDSVRANAALASVWFRIAALGYVNFTGAAAKAEALARKALEFAPEEAAPHAAMAEVHSMMDRVEDAIMEAREAIRINPNFSDAYFTLGVMTASLGRLEEAQTSLRKGYELDPLSYRIAYYLAWVSALLGSGAEALEILERVQKSLPSTAVAFLGLSEIHQYMGNLEVAQQMLDKGLQMSPNEPLLRIRQGVLYAVMGKREAALAKLNEMLAVEKESYQLYGSLFVNAALGNLDEAFKALMRQAETHSWPSLLGSLPLFSDLRKDPRYSEFCAKVGLPKGLGTS